MSPRQAHQVILIGLTDDLGTLAVAAENAEVMRNQHSLLLPLLVFQMNLRSTFPSYRPQPCGYLRQGAYAEISCPRLSGSQGSMDRPATFERVSLLRFTVDVSLFGLISAWRVRG